jgi:carboxyl-terminal processing protease
MTYARTYSLLLLALPGLVGCGGGGSGGGSGGDSTWVAGTFAPASTFEAQCATPRSGIDPITQVRYPDKKGSVLTENNWLRSWSNDLYLWYDEITDRDPGLYSTSAYFDLLKTTATTPSGRGKDQFHFTMPTSQWEALSQSGVSPGYGATWTIIVSTPPRQIVVAYTDPGTPATNLSPALARGATVLKVDGVDAVNGATQANVDAINAGLFPANTGENHTFEVMDQGAAASRTITMTSAEITSTPVQNVQAIPAGAEKVGYILFNDHLANAEEELIAAVNQLKTAGIADLVLDIRYNGGGYLAIASELAYMIAGNARTNGATFEMTVFNAKHPTTDPVTGDPLGPYPFQSTTVFSNPTGTQLPTLDLPRVFVLTGPNTCSASESIINSLEGIDVEVIQVGSTTCGKPYGFYPQDNCGTTYFSIEFKGENAKGFSDYPDGFSPPNTLNNPGYLLPSGCSVGDDYTHALGDPLERRLAAALAYRQTATCPAASGIGAPGTAADTLEEPGDGVVQKPVWLQNRIIRR